MAPPMSERTLKGKESEMLEETGSPKRGVFCLRMLII